MTAHTMTSVAGAFTALPRQDGLSMPAAQPRRGRHSRANSAESVMRALELSVTTIYLATSVCEGALRYFLASVGAGPAIYARDILLAIAVACSICLRPARIELWVTTLALLFGLFVGYAYCGNWFQAAFGLKICLPLLAGVCFAPGQGTPPNSVLEDPLLDLLHRPLFIRGL